MDLTGSITGKVFVKADDNEPAGSGLANVAVSDGRTVVLTARDGTYTIEAPSGPFLFVSLPRGYRSIGPFFARAAPGEVINFPLAECVESRGEVAHFVQITDIHLGFASNNVSTFMDDLAEIDALEPKPSFALITGDLVHIGDDTTQYDSYREGISTLTLPHFSFPGNHDVENATGFDHYHNYLGPDYYSFNFAGCHFVLMNGFPYAYTSEAPIADFLDHGLLPSEEQLPRGVAQLEWLKRDLAAAPPDSTLVIGTHFLPTPTMLRLFTALGARVVLSGHWHGHKVHREGNVLDLNSPNLCFGGIDRHPRSFRLVDIDRNEIRNELRLGGFDRHSVIVAPQGALPSGNDPLPLLVNAYDTRRKIKNVTCRIGNHTTNLRQSTDWSWIGEITLSGQPEETQTLTAIVQTENDETWQTQSTFEPRPTASDLSLKWAAPAGGFIGISSPQVSSTTVAIGVDDTGNLDQCGVTAFDLDGTRRWHFNTDSAIKNRIAVADGRIYATSVAGWLYALDEMSGLLLWKTELGRDQLRWETTATTVLDGVVHAGSSSCIAAFDAVTGQLRWATSGPDHKSDWWPTSYPVPIVAHGTVFLSNLLYGGAFALDAQGGELLWKQEGKFSNFAVHERSLYTVRDGLPTALDRVTGKPLWEGTTSVKCSASNPVLAEDRILMGTADGRIIALSKYDGTLLWEYQTGPALTSLEPYKREGSDVNSTPVVASGRVYAGASDGHLHVISLDTGSLIVTHALGAPIASSPCIKDRTLYVGAYDGNVYSFALPE